MSDVVLVLRINCESAALDYDKDVQNVGELQHELSNILGRVADRLLCEPGYASTITNLRDTNGNTCGTVELKLSRREPR